MSEDFIADVFEAAMAPNSKPMEPSNNVLASPPRLPGANIIDEEVYAQCELISPALPTLEAIRVDVNPSTYWRNALWSHLLLWMLLCRKKF